MKKTTKFSRKRQATGGAYDGGAFIRVLQKCRPYTAPPMPGIGVEATMTAATLAMNKVWAAFVAIKTRNTPPGNTRDFDLLTHAIAVTAIRAIQIAGADVASNPMLQTIVPANAALRRLLNRRRTTGVWGFDGPALLEVAAAIEVYDTVMLSGSPAQMLAATDLYAARELGCVTETLEPLEFSEGMECNA